MFLFCPYCSLKKKNVSSSSSQGYILSVDTSQDLALWRRLGGQKQIIGEWMRGQNRWGWWVWKKGKQTGGNDLFHKHRGKAPIWKGKPANPGAPGKKRTRLEVECYKEINMRSKCERTLLWSHRWRQGGARGVGVGGLPWTHASSGLGGRHRDSPTLDFTSQSQSSRRGPMASPL